MKVAIEVMQPRVFLTQADLEALFGADANLQSDDQDISFFETNKTVKLVGEKGESKELPVYGPVQPQTQLEITKLTANLLGVKAPLRLSGKIIGSGVGKLVGEKGELELKEGIIVAKRYLAVKPNNEFNLHAGQVIKVRVEGPRAIIFEEITVVEDEFIEESTLFLDQEESHAAGIDQQGEGQII